MYYFLYYNEAMRKDKVIQVRVSEELFDIVSSRAKSMGIKNPKYLRNLVISDIKKMKG